VDNANLIGTHQQGADLSQAQLKDTDLEWSTPSGGGKLASLPDT